MAVQEDYEDLDQTSENEDEDRGDFFEDDEDLDDTTDDSEETDDDESDEDDVEEEEEEEEAEEPKKNVRVPISRLDEVIKQREEAKERAAWLEAQIEKLISKEVESKPKAPDKPAYNYDEAEEQYIQLIIEGETVKAAKLRNEINTKRNEDLKDLIAEVTKDTASKVKSESSQILEEERFSTLVESFENKYKFLNADSKDYNEEAVDTVNTLLSGYIAAGKSKSEALKLAVNKVAPLYTKVVDTKQTLGNKRKVEAGKRAVEASKSQPTKTKSVSTRQVDSEKINVSKMSDHEFAKLTEKEKRILRGD